MGYLRTDERGDSLNALEHLAHTSACLAERPGEWKWVIIAAHNAMQSALVCTLSGTAGLGALDKKSMEEVVRFLEETRSGSFSKKPKEKLANFHELYKRAKQRDFMSEFGGSPIETTLEQDTDVERLNVLRNGFIHFTPKGWSIKMDSLPRIVLNALIVFEYLMLRHPANSYRLDEGQRTHIELVLKSIRRELSSWSYET